MAWIKMRTNLPTDGRVMFVAEQTGKHPVFVLGACAWLWMLADDHTVDGKLMGYTAASIDRATGVRGLCEALTKTPGGPWLEVGEGYLQIMDFAKHNGESAKARACNAVRASRHRNKNVRETAHEKRTPVTGTAHESVTGALPREEKRREEETPHTPAERGSDFPGFDRFWAAWPKHHRKEERAKCLTKWRKLGLERLADVVIDGLDRWKTSAEWAKAEGQFIPAPHPWLNKRRWEQAGELVSGSGGFPDMPGAEALRVLRAEGMTP